MNIFITGATGFIGSHIVKKLIEEKHNVICFVRDEDKKKSIQSRYAVSCIVGDLTENKSLEKIPAEEIDAVIHMAAMGHVSSVSEEAYQSFVSINEYGTQNLINVFKHSKKIRKFIHFSSTAAMGFIGQPILNEQSQPNPVTPYQKSKFRSEQVVNKAYIKEKFPAIICRPCMVYGPGGYGEFYKFCRLMKKGVFPKVGSGKNLTPLVYVEDVVNAVMLLLQYGEIGETYIVSSESSIKMDDLHRLIVKYIGVKSPYVYVPAWLALLGAKCIEQCCSILKKEPIVTYQNIKSTVTDRTFDIKKIGAIGYEQKTTFEEGIKTTVNWYKNQHKI